MARLLIVEDEWLIAAEYAFLLRNAGHSVSGPFARVAPALEAIEKDDINAALLDVNLGKDNSFPVARSLQTRGIPFAFLTGHADREELAAFGPTPVLTKPVAPEALLAVLQKLCPPDPR